MCNSNKGTSIFYILSQIHRKYLYSYNQKLILSLLQFYMINRKQQIQNKFSKDININHNQQSYLCHKIQAYKHNFRKNLYLQHQYKKFYKYHIILNIHYICSGIFNNYYHYQNNQIDKYNQMYQLYYRQQHRKYMLRHQNNLNKDKNISHIQSYRHSMYLYNYNWLHLLCQGQFYRKDRQRLMNSLSRDIHKIYIQTQFHNMYLYNYNQQMTLYLQQFNKINKRQLIQSKFNKGKNTTHNLYDLQIFRNIQHYIHMMMIYLYHYYILYMNSHLYIQHISFYNFILI